MLLVHKLMLLPMQGIVGLLDAGGHAFAHAGMTPMQGSTFMSNAHAPSVHADC